MSGENTHEKVTSKSVGTGMGLGAFAPTQLRLAARVLRAAVHDREKELESMGWLRRAWEAVVTESTNEILRKSAVLEAMADEADSSPNNSGQTAATNAAK